jgi:putative tryptophan/tyrosine transport system substrate-binding protein
MHRRNFIGLIGGGAIAWPLAAHAQNSIPVVAYLGVGSPEILASRLAGFRKALSEAGFDEGRNLTVEYHSFNGQYDGLTPALEDLNRRRVAAIVIPGSTPITLVAKKTAAAVPIVFGVAENPVSLGLVDSLAHPGGNATGVNFLALEIDTKRLDLMHDLVPKAKRIAVLLNPANARYTEGTKQALAAAAPAIGVDITFFNASTPDEIETAFAAMERERAEALFIATEAFFSSRAAQLSALAIRYRLPASFANRELARAGLLMTYGANSEEVGHQIGVYVGRILRGAKPDDLPVIQTSKFDLVINMKTAQALGVAVPPMLLARADDVIE